jgi:hypothetical protein
MFYEPNGDVFIFTHLISSIIQNLLGTVQGSPCLVSAGSISVCLMSGGTYSCKVQWWSSCLVSLLVLTTCTSLFIHLISSIRSAILINIPRYSVLPTSAQIRRNWFCLSWLATILTRGLWKPYVKSESGRNLVMYDFIDS